MGKSVSKLNQFLTTNFEGTNNINFGLSNKTGGMHNLVSGKNNKINGSIGYSFISGYNNEIAAETLISPSYTRSFIAGAENLLKDNKNSCIIGSSNTLIGLLEKAANIQDATARECGWNFVSGAKNEIHQSKFCFIGGGTENIIKHGDCAVIFGRNNENYAGDGSLVIGNGNINGDENEEENQSWSKVGSRSIVVGSSNTNTGTNSLINGKKNINNKNYIFASGYQLKAGTNTSNHTTILGYANKEVASALLVIGNGSINHDKSEPNSRSNALVLDESGNLTISGNIISKSGNLETIINALVNAITALGGEVNFN